MLKSKAQRVQSMGCLRSLPGRKPSGAILSLGEVGMWICRWSISFLGCEVMLGDG